MICEQIQPRASKNTFKGRAAKRRNLGSKWGYVCGKGGDEKGHSKTWQIQKREGKTR